MQSSSRLIQVLRIEPLPCLLVRRTRPLQRNSCSVAALRRLPHPQSRVTSQRADQGARRVANLLTQLSNKASDALKKLAPVAAALLVLLYQPQISTALDTLIHPVFTSPRPTQPQGFLPSYAESQREAREHAANLFTEDAWHGMEKLQQYAQFLEEHMDCEDQPGCELCEENRKIVEKIWQIVANEFYSPTGKFTQAGWADQLLTTAKTAYPMKTKQQLYAAAQSMLQQLGDPYTMFLPPSPFRRALRRPSPAERNYLAAQYVGIGLKLGSPAPAGGLVVEAPLAGSPAEQAGIMKGDRVLEIDGIQVAQLTGKELEALMRGPSGSTTLIKWAHASPSSVAIMSEVERRPLPEPAVQGAQLLLPDGREVTYLRMYYFCRDTMLALQMALLQGEARQDVEIAGYILDLRNNPGGVFEDAVAIASFFLDDGKVATKTVRNTNVIDSVWRVGQLPLEIFPDLPDGPLTRKPVAVLVNRNTASASEVLAGALQDNQRALLIGERTFGKGVIQYYFPMADGSGAKVTVAGYLTPGGYDISRSGGLSPNIRCSDYPRGVLRQGKADRCVQAALDRIAAQH